MTNAIRDYFEGRAPTWNSRMPAQLDAALHAMLAPFARDLSAADAVLEIGTGTGALIPHLTACAPGARLTSLDLAHGMLLRARDCAGAARFVEADAHWLPFASGAGSPFDVVVCHNSYPHFADGPRALAEIRRVLRPGGQLLILHNNPRARVNAIHTGASGPIAGDLLPPAEFLRGLLLEAGYIHAWVEDTDAHYVAQAWRS